MQRLMMCVVVLAFGAAAVAQPGRDAKPQAEGVQKPDILFILADDLGWKDVGFHGAPFPTPHIDSLAQRGAELRHHYVQPVCSPTRAAFMTGRYPIRYGLQVGVIRPWADYGLPLNEQTLAQALKTAGYTTAISGKWHLGNIGWEYLPTQRGFDHQYGHLLGAIDYFTHERDGGHDWRRDDQVVHEEGYSTFLLADEIAKLIRRQPADKPLFAYLPFNAVHSPLQAPPEYIKKAADLGITEKRRQTYAAMTMAMDDAIGRVLKALEETGRADRTLVVFTSDNGGPEQLGADNGELRGQKGTLYEGGVRVPTVVVWPGKVKAGSRIEAAVHIVDWYPTLTKLTGAQTMPAGPLDGRDIVAVLTQGAASPHEEIVHNITPNKAAIRVGDWKLVTSRGEDEDEDEAPAKKGKKAASKKQADPPLELFNIAADPTEQNNLASQHPEKVQELTRRLEVHINNAVPHKTSGNRAGENFQPPKVWGPTK